MADQQQKEVFNFFQSFLDSEARSYTLWKELERTIPKGVFRRLRLTEPFPGQKKPDAKRPKPYSRPVPEVQSSVPLLSLEEKKQLEELNKTRAPHAAVIAAAQQAAQEAENKSKYILEASSIRKEKEKLRLREQALVTATQKTTVRVPLEPQPGPSRQRPTLLEKINQEIRAQMIPKPLPIEVRSTASTPKQRYSRIIPAEKKNKRLARKFAGHGLDTSSEEDEILKSPVLA